ncbi:MAG TPA: M14 metallopeptidase family protein [Acidobacteriota bacterium]|nr:M14 metallopeptidase family protein [Acidobacteriota bacterium]
MKFAAKVSLLLFPIFLWIYSAAAIGALSPPSSPITPPEKFLGFRVGADRKLAPWPKIVEYFHKLDTESDRITVQELGKTTDGRPFIVAYISSPENLKKLDIFRQMNQKLADPRGLTDAQAEPLIKREAKIIALITCNIHSTEAASAQSAMEFAYNMATQNDPQTQLILNNVITLLVPSLNPDGQHMVVDWYNKTLGTPYEGTSPPFLYHRYVGHDNNRDWYMFTQVETRLTVSKLHNVWHPQVAYDVHQMGDRGARIFVPPWLDPVDPNIDPILQQQSIYVGASMATDLTAAGKKGVVMNAMYDLWTPSRHYQNYHGGFRILTESASVRIATPVNISFNQLESEGRGYSPKRSSWNFPEPWPGGEWRLRDIVDYQLIAFRSLLYTMANDRERFLRNFYLVGKKAIGPRSDPFAFVVPAKQKDPAAAVQMLDTLRFGMVEIERATSDFTADGLSYPAGSYIIALSQPYGSWAKTLLERQNYPDLREYPGGPPKRPYDVTAQTLPYLMGVDTVTIRGPFKYSAKPLDQAGIPPGKVDNGNARAGFLLERRTNNDTVALYRLMKAGYQVALLIGGTDKISRGAAFISPSDPRPAIDLSSQVQLLSRELGIDFLGLNEAPSPLMKIHLPRVGLYQSYVPSMDEGWTRWIFEQFAIPYQTIHDGDIRKGDLNSRFDAILLPSETPSAIIQGHPRGTMPPEFTGGTGEDGLKNMKTFVETGGTLITFNEASKLPLRWNLGVDDVTRGVPTRELYGPGSILNANVVVDNLFTTGMDRKAYIWFEASPAFSLASSRQIHPLIQYPSSNLLASGWLLGEEKLADRYAAVSVDMGKGRVILFGFRPQYRGQSHSTYKLVFNSILYAAAEK